MSTKTTVLKQRILLCLLISCFSFQFRPAHAFVHEGITSPHQRNRLHTKSGCITHRSILRAQDNQDDAEEENDPVVNEFLAMQEADRRVNRNLMLPRTIMSTIGSTIQYLAYGFLISQFALNIFGYAIINDGDMIRIGTLEERDFQMEIRKSVKEK